MNSSSENIAPREEFWKELLKLIILAVIIVVPFRLYVAKPFIVDGASMDPTFKNGQYLIVDEFTYHFSAPKRGSVLIFKAPHEPNTKYYVKRVIGLPLETVLIKQGEVIIVNEKHPRGFKLSEPYVEFKKSDTMSFTLKAGEYFVMGDNRLGSSDSRIWGAVPEANIIGRPYVRFYPPSILPGEVASYQEELINQIE